MTLSVQVDDTQTPPVGVAGASVRIERISDGSLIAEGTTNGSGLFSASFDYTADVDVLTKARLKGFRFFRTSGTITSSGLSVGVRFEPNTIVDLP